MVASHVRPSRSPIPSTGDSYVRTLRTIALLGCVISFDHAAAKGGAVEEAERLFRTGQYEQCAALAVKEISKDEENERWSQLKIKAEMTCGKYEAALTSAESSLRQFPWSLPLHLLAREVCQANGRDREAAALLKAIEQLVTEAPHRYGTPEDRLLLGRFLLIRVPGISETALTTLLVLAVLSILPGKSKWPSYRIPQYRMFFLRRFGPIFFCWRE